MSAEEKELYDVTNDFLRRDPLYSIPNANRGLIILVIRKLLASSSFALIETFEVLEKRLEKLYEGTKSAYAQEGFDLFWGFVEDEIDEDGFNEYDDEETAEKKQAKKHGAGIECAFRDFVDPRDPSNNFGWRPFQIAFILINLKGIVDPEHDNREVVDLLYFPTGGGKTEAYLGLMAFVIANRRLRAEENDEYNRDGGVTAILRYTLRLLTTQQRDRITKMILAAELIRQKEYSLLDELEMRWEDEQKLNGLSSVHSMGFRQFIFYLAHKVDFIAEIFLCTMILFGNVGAQPAASFLLKFASFAKFLKQPESLCCFCTNQIFNFFSCNTAVFQCILKNE